MTTRITILGCGSSGGVPRVAQGWGVCDPKNPLNRRRRCSILVEQIGPDGVTQVLVDTSPDLRDQLLSAGVDRLDAVLMTHPHADHTNGIDDLRPLVIHMKRRLDIFLDEQTSEMLRRAFGYIFETPEGSNYPPLLNEHRIRPGHGFTVEGAGGPLDVMPFRLDHGEIDALGFRFNDIVYSPDFKSIYPESISTLEGLDLWIIDGLRHTLHPTHISIPEALEFARHYRAKRTVLTNLSSEVDYEQLRAELPQGVEAAHDLMVLTV